MNSKTLIPGRVIPASFDKVFKSIWQDERNKNLLLYMISKLLLINKNRIYQNLVFINSKA